MLKRRMIITVAGVAASFAGLVGVIIFLLTNKIVSSAMAMLMLVALFGLYTGFGILIAVYRFIDKLN